MSDGACLPLVFKVGAAFWFFRISGANGSTPQIPLASSNVLVAAVRALRSVLPTSGNQESARIVISISVGAAKISSYMYLENGKPTISSGVERLVIAKFVNTVRISTTMCT